MLTPTLICAAVLVVAACVRRIPEGQAYTLRRMDGHVRTLGAGMHFVLPLIERVAHKIRLLGNVVAIEPIAVPGQNATLSGEVYYQVLDAKRADTIIDEVSLRVREQLPRLLAEAADGDSAERNLQLKSGLNRMLRDSGLLITRVRLG
jgi:regulator of protease activity HflC (stomatin/prohibitin superfamily)